MSALWLVIVAIVALAVAVFAGDNLQPVSIAFLSLRATTSLPLIVLISFFCGAAAASALALPGRIRLRRQVRRLQQAAARVPAQAPLPEAPPTQPPSEPGPPDS